MPFNCLGSGLSTKSLLHILFGVFIGYLLAYVSLFSEISLTPKWTFRADLDRAIMESDGVYLGSHNHSEEFDRSVNTSVAEALSKKVRVLCWIMTQPNNHKKKAMHVKATWGKRCNVLLFMSSIHDESLPSIPLPVEEGRDNLWAKTKQAFEYVYRNYYDEADWFMKADDDTYVIVENLRYMLMQYDTSDPIYFGCRFKPYVQQGYMSGGAGYVLSKKALSMFIEKGLPNAKACRQTGNGAEDLQMGTCLGNIGVLAMDSRDSMKRRRFFPFMAETFLNSKAHLPAWYKNYRYYKDKEGLECCSDIAISFHYVPPEHMYIYDYFLYHLHPYGISMNYNISLSNSSTSIIKDGN